MAVKKSVEMVNEKLMTSDEIEVIKLNQDIIERMSKMSIKVKDLTLNFYLAFLLLSFLTNWSLVANITSIVIIASFWYMDARYLQLEQQFRCLHKDIVTKTITIENAWRFNPTPYKVEFIKPFTSFSTLTYPLMMLSFVALHIFLNR